MKLTSVIAIPTYLSSTRFVLGLLGVMCLLVPQWVQSEPQFVGREVCADCHQQQVALWQGSHHDWAMREANDESVLGNFGGEAGITFDHYGEKTHFFERDGQYWVKAPNSDGELQTFLVRYTFGFYPLQQYLLDVGDGRLQALSVSWDSRSVEEGGQRWFHLYPDEAIPYNDPLHWTGPYQNWNNRCAECHSTNLERNFIPAEDGSSGGSYDTQWSEINVSCEACHGPASDHVEQMTGHQAKKETLGLRWQLDAVGQWLNEDKRTTAVNSDAAAYGDKKQHAQLSVCGSCHARRSLIADQDDFGEFHQRHNLTLPQSPLYHADGQILDEVYVLGSFMQSKMHQQGVVCSNCHEPHSLKLRAEGNGVCAQCHRPDVFDQPSHHHHPVGSSGADCANCHMPETTYMVVDPRRDHSLRVPRPDLSVAYGTPNACNQCHQDKTFEWARDAVASWQPSKGAKSRGRHFSDDLTPALSGSADAQSRLMNLAMAGHQPALIQASALLALQNHMDQTSLLVAQTQLHHANPMVRAAAVELVALQAVDARWRDLLPMLNDSSKQVRMAVARHLAATPPGTVTLSADQNRFWQAGQQEYQQVLTMHQDTPDGQMNIGLYALARGELLKAEQAYQTALAMNASLVGAYLNLADLYRQQNDEKKSEAILRQGLKRLPEVAALLHSLGLSQVRQKAYTEASASLGRAAELDPQNSRYSYLYGLVLQRLQQPQAAVQEWKRALEFQPADRDLLMALLDQSQRIGNAQAALEYAERLLTLNPADQRLQRLVSRLRSYASP